MDFRKFDSYVILLAIVVVAGLLVSMVARFVILAKGADTGTANLVFLIVLGICAIFYLTIIAASSSVADFIIRVFTPHMARRTCCRTVRPGHRTDQAGSRQAAGRTTAGKNRIVPTLQPANRRPVHNAGRTGPAQLLHRHLCPEPALPGRTRTHPSTKT